MIGRNLQFIIPKYLAMIKPSFYALRLQSVLNIKISLCNLFVKDIQSVCQIRIKSEHLIHHDRDNFTCFIVILAFVLACQGSVQNPSYKHGQGETTARKIPNKLE
ncbi:MAG: hypothetical protein A2Y97_02855 [Nitrospirae bacterium RBG_13_39_12]|nr:MAG: hypothetical protein A2Y97_02855 [Nitrospirae bacterium RBG_13_39_12]